MSTTLRSRSAIEAHRTRLAGWKRSMSPLFPKISRFSGTPNARIVRFCRSFERSEIRTPCRVQGIYILLQPNVRTAHIVNNRSIVPIKASLIVALNRLLLIDYCITNPAVIKYSSNALRTIQCSSNHSAILPYSNKAIHMSLREAYIS